MALTNIRIFTYENSYPGPFGNDTFTGNTLIKKTSFAKYFKNYNLKTGLYGRIEIKTITV